MAAKRCPGCGAPYRGKRCPLCLYEPFGAEITPAFHREEPLSAPRSRNPRVEVSKKPRLPLVVILVVVFTLWVVLGLVFTIAQVHSAPQPEPITLPLPEDGTVLFDEGGIRVILGWNGGEITGDIPVYLENNSDQDVLACTNGVAVNGMMVDSVFFYVDARRNTTSMSQLWIDTEELKSLGIGQIAQISLTMELLEERNYMLLNNPELITFGPGGTISAADILGEPLIKSGELLLVFQGTYIDSYGSVYLQFYAENRTGEILELSSEELIVNEQPTGQYLWQRFLPDTGAVIRAVLYEADSLGIKLPEDISRLELSVTTVDENWEIRTQSDTIVLQLGK